MEGFFRERLRTAGCGFHADTSVRVEVAMTYYEAVSKQHHNDWDNAIRLTRIDLQQEPAMLRHQPLCLQ